MSWFQKTIRLEAKHRGFHLVSSEILVQLPELIDYNVGLASFFIQHTSASLTINENADATVRTDMEKHFNVMVPENAPYYDHTLEGSDDMPAHIKSSIVGNSIVVPITNGTLNLGIWQGIYLCEHRDNSTARSIVVTLQGELF